jgi:hypothetical protein
MGACVLDPGLPHPSNDHLRQQVRLVVIAVGSTENQVPLHVVAGEQPPVLLLLFALEAQHRERRLRQPADAGFVVFWALASQSSGGLL